MRSATIPILALAATAMADTAWHYGDTVWFGPATNSYIKKLTYSVVPPATPTDYAQDDAWLSLWMGLTASSGNSSAVLIQPDLHWAVRNADQGCHAPVGQWCVTTSAYLGPAAGQNGQAYAVVPKGSIIQFETVSSGTMSQTVSIGGKVVASQTNTGGIDNPIYVEGSNECYSGECGSLGAYTWKDMVVTLSAADKNFGHTLGLQPGASSNGFTTPDGGVTWKGDIKFSADRFLS